MNKKHTIFSFILLLILLAACTLFSMCAGSAGIKPADAVRTVLSGLPFTGVFIDSAEISPTYITIIQRIRLPRIFLSMLVGGILSMTGAVFQGIFKNPLADPHILGVSSGAALGATVAILSGTAISFAGLGSISIAAFAGAIITIIIICGFSGLSEHTSAVAILLTGTAVSTLMSSIISLLMSLNHDSIEKVYMWTLGSFNAASWEKVAYTSAAALVGFILLMFSAKDLNLLAMDEDTARSLGVNTPLVRIYLIIISSLMIAVCVSVSGIISFVGLIIPHCIRKLVSSNYRILIPAAFLGGGIFLMAGDTIARTINSPSELPIGVVTAIIGAPYFIYLIRRRSHV